MGSKRFLILGAIAVAVTAGLASLAGCGGGSAVEEASAERVAELLSSGVRVIDVRTPAEFEASHLPRAENVPVDQLASDAASWDRSEPLLIYCTTGARSSASIRTLADMGFEQIHHFTDGLVAWGGELERGTVVAEMPPAEKPVGTPVMYEFFTDW